jgi:hypothetical protein
MVIQVITKKKRELEIYFTTSLPIVAGQCTTLYTAGGFGELYQRRSTLL